MNPELQRNVWLEYSLQRLLTLATVLGVFFYFIYLVSHEVGMQLNIIAKICFVFFTMAWGVRQVSDAFIEEVRQHTWDWQRMSPISPWSLLWGKWLGSTLYSWYGAVLSLCMIYASSSLTPVAQLLETLALVLCAIIAQGISLLLCLQMFKRNRSLMRFHSHLSHLSGLLVGLFLILLVLSGQNMKFEYWYSIPANNHVFLLTSIIIFCFWVVLGTQRLISSELQIKNGSLAWLSFIIFILFYVGGCMPTAFNGLSFCIAIGMSYLMLILEGAKPMLLQQIQQDFSLHQWKVFFQKIPCWLVSLPIIIIYAVITMLTEQEITMFNLQEHIHLFYIALILFFIRDVLIVSLIQSRHEGKRKDASIILYFIMLYTLMPTIAAVLGSKQILAIFVPLPTFISIIAAMLQIMFCLFFLWQHIHLNATTKPSDPIPH